MREILFRGYCKEELMGSQWVEGFGVFNCECVDDTEEHLILFSNSSNNEVYPESVGEYIGIKDVNGKKVFEGDIVEITYKEYEYDGETVLEHSIKGFIKEDFCGFDICSGYHKNIPVMSGFIPETNIIGNRWDIEWEVIGNIYENPNFLKEE